MGCLPLCCGLEDQRNGLSAVLISYGVSSVLTIKDLDTTGGLMRGSLTSQKISPLYPMAELFGVGSKF